MSLSSEKWQDTGRGLQRWNLVGIAEWQRKNEHREKTRRYFTHKDKPSSSDTECIRTIREDILMSPSTTSRLIKSLSFYLHTSLSLPQHDLTFPLLHTSELLISPRMLWAVYRFYSWQDHSFEELLNNSSDDTLWRWPASVLFKVEEPNWEIGR